MSLIDTSDFVGPLTIAQIGQASVSNDLTQQINKYESEFLWAALGIELYTDFIAGLSAPSPAQMWIDLRDGKVFNLTTNFPGYFPMYMYRFWVLNQTRKVRWVGLKPNQTDTPGVPADFGQSPIVGYIYYKYMRNLLTQAGGAGIVQSQSENATGQVAAIKMRDAWNQMVNDLSYLWFFLAANGSGVYSSYNLLDIDFYTFQKINMFNI